MAKNIRNNPGFAQYDPSSIAGIEFNPAAGSQKVSEVGRSLLPIPIISGGVLAYTTDASTVRRLPSAGKCLAVYNNTTTVGAITLGDDTNTPTALAVGVTNTVGQVGIPCAPNAWTYIACANKTKVISSAATLLVFMVDDETTIKPETTS